MSLFTAIQNYLATATIVTVPVSDAKRFESKLKGLVKKASKNGVDPIEVAVIGDLDVLVNRHNPELSIHERSWHNAIKVWEPCRAYSITGVFPRMKDQYDLVGVVEFDAGMTIVREVPGQTVPVEYRTAGRHCDHCKTSRPRKQVIIVKNTETGALLQVGGSCAGEFLGRSVKDILASFEVKVFLSDATFGGDEDEGFGGGFYNEPLIRNSYIACVMQAVRVQGSYRSAKSDGLSTAAMALTNYDNRSKRDVVPPTEVDYQNGQAMIAEALEKLDRPMMDLSTYEWNMKMALSEPFMNRKLSGIAASLPAYLQKFRAPTEKKVSGYVGAVGDRATFTLTYVRSFSWDSQFGVQYRHLFRDADGNVFVWKTGNYPSHNGADIQAGDVVEIKGTIKEHSEYKEIKQTVLTRCTVLGVREEQAA